MPMQENREIAHRFEEAYNTGNVADAAEFIAPSFAQRGPGVPPVPPGPQGYQEGVRAFRSAFPDLHVTIDDMVVAEDKVAVRFHARGTHRGEFQGIAPTGKPVETTGIDIIHIANGQITEAWTEIDSLSFYRQLGVVQPQVAQAVR